MSDKRRFAGPDSKHIVKPIQQLYREAEMRIGELEREKQWLQNRMAWLLVSVNALGRHFKLEPHECKAIVDKFIEEQEVEMGQQVEVAKQKFSEDLKNGKMPQFRVIDNPDKKDDANGGAPATS